MGEINFDVDGVTYTARRPTVEESRQAQKVYNRAFNDAIASGSPLQAKATDILKEQGLWNDSKQAELEGINKQLLEGEFTLHKGGIYKTEARKVALNLKRLRASMQDLLTPITNFNQHTAEGQANNARFDYLVSVCVVYNNNTPAFSSYEDYLNRSNETVALLGAGKFAELYYQLNDDFQDKLPENQFLKEHKFVDDKYRLIDGQGRLIDEDGRLVNENGNLVNESGSLIDVLGHTIDAEGNFTVERQPFLEDSEQDKKKKSKAVSTK